MPVAQGGITFKSIMSTKVVGLVSLNSASMLVAATFRKSRQKKKNENQPTKLVRHLMQSVSGLETLGLPYFSYCSGESKTMRTILLSVVEDEFIIEVSSLYKYFKYLIYYK
jgi:hypothetical protein